MMYLFHGSDTLKTRKKAFEWIATAREKEPNLVYVRLSREELTSAALEEATFSGGLFVKRLLILIDDPFLNERLTNEEEEGDNEEKNIGSIVEEHLDHLAVSDNAIVILAPKLSVTKAKKIAAKAKMEYRFDKLAQRERGFNTNLVNALASRSRARLWIEINRALLAGDPPQMLHGVLHWKARDLMEKGSPSWAPKEARVLSLSLIKLLQESRRGGLDLALSLERFALSI
jgi:hypothetical protein